MLVPMELHHGAHIDKESRRISAIIELRVPEILEFKGNFKPGGNGDKICSGLLFNATAAPFTFKVVFAAEPKCKSVATALKTVGIEPSYMHNPLSGMWQMNFRLPKGWEPPQ